MTDLITTPFGAQSTGGVSGLGPSDLTLDGLRPTGATWMADAGIPLHV